MARADADRPHLRPILDVVLVALPSLGPVRVEARQTLVSLVTGATVEVARRSRTAAGDG